MNRVLSVLFIFLFISNTLASDYTYTNTFTSTSDLNSSTGFWGFTGEIHLFNNDMNVVDDFNDSIISSMWVHDTDLNTGNMKITENAKVMEPTSVTVAEKGRDFNRWNSPVLDKTRYGAFSRTNTGHSYNYYTYLGFYVDKNNYILLSRIGALTIGSWQLTKVVGGSETILFTSDGFSNVFGDYFSLIKDSNTYLVMRGHFDFMPYTSKIWGDPVGKQTNHYLTWQNNTYLSAVNIPEFDGNVMYPFLGLDDSTILSDSAGFFYLDNFSIDSNYVSDGNLTSTRINTGSAKVSKVKLTANDTQPANTDINYYVSANYGVTWVQIEKNETVDLFSQNGNYLQWRVALRTDNNIITPSVQELILDYNVTKVETTLIQPNGNNYLSLMNTNADGFDDGNHGIDFNVISYDSNYLRLRIYRSLARDSFSNLLYDVNLTELAVNPTSDFNCGVSSIDFASTRTCHVDYNIMDSFGGDGNFFVDLNVSQYGTDTNSTGSSLTAFVIDTNRPSTTWDGNTVWQQTNANVHLACVDSGGCDLTKLFYRIDSDKTSSIELGGNTLYDSNVLFLVANGDGNFALDFNVMDLAGNVSDTNRQFVLLDNNAPHLTSLLPIGNTSQSNATWIFTFNIVDGNGSGGTSCDYNAYVNNVSILQNQSGSVAGSICTVSFGHTPADGANVDVNVMVTDSVGLKSAIFKSFYSTYSPTTTTPSSGGGGGSTVIITGDLFEIKSPTKVIGIMQGGTKVLIVEITNLTSQNIAVLTSPDAFLTPFVSFSPASIELKPYENVLVKVTFSVPNDFNNASGIVTFNANDGEQVSELEFELQREQGLEFLGADIGGIPIVLIAFVAIIGFFISRALK